MPSTLLFYGHIAFKELRAFLGKPLIVRTELLLLGEQRLAKLG